MPWAFHSEHNDASPNSVAPWSVSCGPRSWHATPVSIVAGRTMMQFSRLCSSMTLFGGWNAGQRHHISFQILTKSCQDMNLQKLAEFHFFFSSRCESCHKTQMHYLIALKCGMLSCVQGNDGWRPLLKNDVKSEMAAKKWLWWYRLMVKIQVNLVPNPSEMWRR